MIAVSGGQRCGVGRGSMREDVSVTGLNGLFVSSIYTQASCHWSKILRYFEARRKIMCSNWLISSMLKLYAKLEYSII